MTPTQEIIASIWIELLKNEDIQLDSNFFWCGGDSIMAVSLVNRLREVFPQDIPLRAIFEHSILSDLANYIDNKVQVEPQKYEYGGTKQASLIGPASFGQERLWILDQLEPCNAAYNIPWRIELRGRLNIEALTKSINLLAERHEVFRTRIQAQDNELIQIVDVQAPTVLRFVDLSEEEIECAFERSLQLSLEEARRTFDLHAGPMLRATLMRLDDEMHVLVLVRHHITSDAWSGSIFFRELAIAYEAYCAGKEPSLPALAVRYIEYAIRQKEESNNGTFRAHVYWWKQHLNPLPASVTIPEDYPRPRVMSYRGARCDIGLSASEVKAMQHLCERADVTMFMMLVSVLGLILYRYSNNSDMIIGTTIAGRDRKDLEGLVGFCANTLPILLRLTPDMTVLDMLRHVRVWMLDMFAHQSIPFEVLVKELQPPRELERNPLFQVMLILDNVPFFAPRLPGLTAKSEEMGNGTTKFDLTIYLRQDEGKLRGYFEYATDIFRHDTIQQLVRSFQIVCKGIDCNPEAKISQVPLIDADERQEISLACSGVHVDIPKLAVHQSFEKQVDRYPHMVALRSGSVALTYAELNARANQIAHFLQQLGVAPEVPVGIFMERSLDSWTSILAVLKAGGAYVPFDVNQPEKRLQYIAENAQPLLILTDGKVSHAQRIFPAIKIVNVSEIAHAVEMMNPENLQINISMNQMAYLLYTSGSTGMPKGVVMEHHALANLLTWQIRQPDFSSGYMTLQYASLGFDVSFQETFSTWLSGGELVLIDENSRRDPEILVRYVSEQHIQRLFLPFAMLNQFARAVVELGFALHSLRHVIVAGEQLQITENIAALFRRLPEARLENQYGPTETHVVSSFVMPKDRDTWPILPPIGHPIDNVDLHVLDSHRQPVPRGVRGELYISGQALARGYRNSAKLTSASFLYDSCCNGVPFRVYRTGDLVRVLPDGNLEYCGRIDRQVKVRGYRIEPDEIEAILMKHPSVTHAVVVAHGEAADEKRLVAYYTLMPVSHVKQSELLQYLAARLPSYMVPNYMAPLDNIPLTANGKVDFRRLPTIAAEDKKEELPFEDSLERQLGRLWCEVLQVDHVNRHDSFFDQGGHSLLGATLLSRIRQNFGVTLPMRSLFESPTLEQIAEAIKEIQNMDREIRPVAGMTHSDRQEGSL